MQSDFPGGRYLRWSASSMDAPLSLRTRRWLWIAAGAWLMMLLVISVRVSD